MEIKTIPNFPDYAVSMQGKVYSLKYNKQKEIQIKIDRYGYARVGLWKEGKRYDRTVHQLVAVTFLNQPDGYTQIDHIDRNKLNNDVSNLRWVTAKENIANKTFFQRVEQARINGNMKSKRVAQYSLSGIFIESYPSIAEAQRQTGITHISDVCQKKIKYDTKRTSVYSTYGRWFYMEI